MARAKRVSDEAYNARRRARRAKERLDRDLASGKIESSSALGQAAKKLSQSLGSSISKSYASKTGKREYSASAQAALREGERTARSLRQKRDDEQERSNRIFGRNLSEATRKDGFSSVTKTEAQVFYRLTQRTWEGKDPNARNQIIADRYGNGSLIDAFNNIMSTDEAKEALEKARAAGEDIGDTEKDEFAKEDSYDADQRYKSWIALVSPFS